MESSIQYETLGEVEPKIDEEQIEIEVMKEIIRSSQAEKEKEPAECKCSAIF